LAGVVSLNLYALTVAQPRVQLLDTRVQLLASGALSKTEVAPPKQHLARSESVHLVRSEVSKHSNNLQDDGNFFSPLQLAAEVGSKASAGNLPWGMLPLCEFSADHTSSSLIRVFVNKDNTRAFVFDGDAKGAQTQIQCHGATPEFCTKSHLLDSGLPMSCEKAKECGCNQVALSMESIHMDYVKKMVHKVAPLCTRKGGANVLHIGLGGGALSSYLLENCAKGTRITSVEKDPRVIAMAKKFFGFRVEQGRHDVENLDALVAVQGHVKGRDEYDVVLVDCFESNRHVPESCSSQSFLTGVRQILKPGGMVIQQVWTSQYSELFHNYHTVFGKHLMKAEPVDESKLNFLIVASDSGS